MARKLHDPLNEGRVILVMDGTYIYTQSIESDHELRQSLWNQHKHSTLLKPHLTICTNGKIVHGGDIFWGNKCGSDTHIYHSMTDVESLKRFLANPSAADCPFEESQVKELLYFNKIWSSKGIAITDNGYKIIDARIRKPKDTAKGKSGSTLANHWKRSVTMIRQVTERVNASIKKWKMIGDGKLRASEIPFLSLYLTIAMGHHNEFSCVYQTDHVNNEIQMNRLLEIRTVIENPCTKYWIPRPPNRKKPKKGEPPLPILPPFDDGFNTVAQTLDEVKGWISNCAWLKKLDLKKEDGLDLVGRQFQHRLCHRYLKFLESNFRLKVHKSNGFVLKFENLRSKYKSSTNRHVILNLDHVVKCKLLRSLNQDPNQSHSRFSGDVQDSNHNRRRRPHVSAAFSSETIQSPARALPVKQWKDIDFSLWETDLARLQYFCTCNAGAQMVNPCAHVSATVYLLIWTLTGVLEERLQPSARDMRIRSNVTNLGPLIDFWKKQETLNKKSNVTLYCRCNQPFHDYMVQCPGCEEHYHPKCIGTTRAAIERVGLSQFKCSACDPFSMLFKERECSTANAVGLVPPLQQLSGDEESMDVDM